MRVPCWQLILGFLSNRVSKLAHTAVNLVGEWLALNALPAYRNQSTISFGSVALLARMRLQLSERKS